MSQTIPFAASLQGKLANGGSAVFFATMAMTGLNSEPKDFNVLFIGMTCVAICMFINSITMSLEDYPKEALTMVILIPFVAGPLLAWTMIAGGGAAWKAYLCAAIALMFTAFIVKPPSFKM